MQRMANMAAPAVRYVVAVAERRLHHISLERSLLSRLETSPATVLKPQCSIGLARTLTELRGQGSKLEHALQLVQRYEGKTVLLVDSQLSLCLLVSLLIHTTKTCRPLTQLYVRQEQVLRHAGMQGVTLDTYLHGADMGLRLDQ